MQPPHLLVPRLAYNRRFTGIIFMSVDPMPRVVAHRGASGYAPENTLAAIQLAAEQGATWIEIDVNISLDGVPLLHHDDGLERCTNGSGLVIEHDIESLSKLDSGQWFDEKYAGERIATLKQCLDLCLELGLSINLEVKPCSGWEIPTTTRIAETLNLQKDLPPILISSFSHFALQCAEKLLPAIPRSSLFLVAPPDWRELTNEVKASNIHLHANSLLTAESVAQFHAADLGVYCYTVNTTEKANSIYQLEVDGVFTNYPVDLLTP